MPDSPNSPIMRIPATLVTVIVLAAAVFLFFVRRSHTVSPPPVFRVPGQSAWAHRPRIPLSARNQQLTLDPTGKFLINSISNKPVFLTGEDAFALQIALSDADQKLFLDDRAQKGFNALWIGLADPIYARAAPKDFYGNPPFNGPDFTNANPAYWARVDQTIRWAADRNITVFAGPAFIGWENDQGYLPSFRRTSSGTFSEYGQFLGSRYKGFPNIVWLIGGDADPREQDLQTKLDALARGIRSADPNHLITTENQRGASSAEIWSQTAWLDLDALYTTALDIPARANAAYLRGTYPVFMFEDWYEGDQGLTPADVRKQGYWAVLSGCTLGRFFGNHAIWDFSFPRITSDPWKQELDSPGSTGQSWLGKLFRSRQHWKFVPDADHSVLTDGYTSWSAARSSKENLRSWLYQLPLRAPKDLAVAARASDGRTIVVYIPDVHSGSVAISMDKISDPRSLARCWWFDPRTGASTLIGELPSTGPHEFTKPDGGDWVLVIDSATADFGAPAVRDQ